MRRKRPSTKGNARGKKCRLEGGIAVAFWKPLQQGETQGHRTPGMLPSLHRFGTQNNELVIDPADTHGLEGDLTSSSTFGPEVHCTSQGHHGLIDGDANLVGDRLRLGHGSDAADFPGKQSGFLPFGPEGNNSITGIDGDICWPDAGILEHSLAHPECHARIIKLRARLCGPGGLEAEYPG